MNFRRKAHPIPLPKRQFDITQLSILQHGIQVGQGNLRPILLRGGEVKAHGRPSSTKPGSFKHGPVPKPNLRHPTTHVLLIVEQEAELLQIAKALGEQLGLDLRGKGKVEGKGVKGSFKTLQALRGEGPR